MNNRAGSQSCKICFSIYKEDPLQFFPQIETNFVEFFFFFNVPTNYSGIHQVIYLLPESNSYFFPFENNLFYSWFFSSSSLI